MRRVPIRPASEDTFLVRICKALDVSPRTLASRIGVKYKDVEPLLDARHLLAEIDRDEVWWKVGAYVDGRLGDMMAIRHELNAALQRDRTKRAVRIAAQRARDRKGSPRGKT